MRHVHDSVDAGATPPVLGALLHLSSWRLPQRSVALLLSLGLLTVFDVQGTAASWVDEAGVSGTTITAGTIDLKVESSDIAVTNYTALNVADLESGGSTAALIRLTNSGTAGIDFWVDAATTNADGKGLGATMTARATWGNVTGSSPNVTCTGTALGGTPKPLGVNAIGSPSTPLRLAAGTTASLCVELALPPSAQARGGATTVEFTFNASAAPGSSWTDSVKLGTANVKSVTMGFLRSTAFAPSPTSFTTTLAPPTTTTLVNYDSVDNRPGLYLPRATTVYESDTSRNPRWNYVLPESMTFSGTATLRLWTAMAEFNSVRRGSMQVGLFACDNGGGSCTVLTTAKITSSGAWSEGSNTWVLKTFTLGGLSGTMDAGRVLQVRVTVDGSTSEDAMMLAYDTTTYRSALILK